MGRYYGRLKVGLHCIYCRIHVRIQCFHDKFIRLIFEKLRIYDNLGFGYCDVTVSYQPLGKSEGALILLVLLLNKDNLLLLNLLILKFSALVMTKVKIKFHHPLTLTLKPTFRGDIIIHEWWLLKVGEFGG